MLLLFIVLFMLYTVIENVYILILNVFIRAATNAVLTKLAWMRIRIYLRTQHEFVPTHIFRLSFYVIEPLHIWCKHT